MGRFTSVITEVGVPQGPGLELIFFALYIALLAGVVSQIRVLNVTDTPRRHAALHLSQQSQPLMA